jgi:hypothetical protein
MEKFNKKDRSTWAYFWAHWFAFQMTAVMLMMLNNISGN